MHLVNEWSIWFDGVLVFGPIGIFALHVFHWSIAIVCIIGFEIEGINIASHVVIIIMKIIMGAYYGRYAGWNVSTFS